MITTLFKKHCNRIPNVMTRQKINVFCCYSLSKICLRRTSQSDVVYSCRCRYFPTFFPFYFWAAWTSRVLGKSGKQSCERSFWNLICTFLWRSSPEFHSCIQELVVHSSICDILADLYTSQILVELYSENRN